MPARISKKLSKGGRFYRTHRGIELARKRGERARIASAAYGFIETHPRYKSRWHPHYDEREHVYRLSRKEESDWRHFLRRHGWEVGEKGRTARISEHLPPGRKPRPLPREQEEARKRFHSEALGRAPESYRPLY